jgi:PAS domain S-box-containing protein
MTATNNGKSLRVLAVDDEQGILDLYRQVLTPATARPGAGSKLEKLSEKLFGGSKENAPSQRVDLVLCRQGDDAVKQVGQAVEEDHPYAIAFLDMRMPPGPDGLWTAEEIRKLDPHVTIIIVTAFSDVDPRAIEGKVPPSDKLLYIQKPITAPEIRQFVSSLGKKWNAEKELREIQCHLGAQFGEAMVQIISMKDELDETRLQVEALKNAYAASEEALLGLIENGSSLVVRSDLQSGEFLYVGPQCKYITGFQSDELHGFETAGFRERIHPDDIEKYDKVIVRQLAEGNNGKAKASVTYKWQSSDSEYISLREARVILRDNQGNRRYVVATIDKLD